MPFLPPNQQHQSTEGCSTEGSPHFPPVTESWRCHWLQVRPLDNGDRLPMPSPKQLPKTSQRPRVRMRRRHPGPRLEPAVAAELALSTIAEESSQHHSTSSVSVDVEPEMFVDESSAMMSSSPPPYAARVSSSSPAAASPACCVCHATRVRAPVPPVSASNLQGRI